MDSALDYLDIDIHINENNLCIYQKATAKLVIKNKSNCKVQNIVLSLSINEKIFKVLNPDCNGFINKFGNIGSIEPGFMLTIDVPLSVISIPESFKESIYSYISFHTVEAGELMDFSYESTPLIVNFNNEVAQISKSKEVLQITEPNIERFKIKPLKDTYFIDEDIELDITIKNESINEMKNVIIYDYLPKNTSLCQDSLNPSYKNKYIFKDNSIFIEKVNPKEFISIRFKVNIVANKIVDTVRCKPYLNYLDSNANNILANCNYIEIGINKNYIFNDSSFIYTIDKNEYFLNDIVTHKITILNNVKIDTFDLLLNAINLDSLEFIEDSLIINNIYQNGETLSTGINLGDLDYNEKTVVVFKTKVISLGKTSDMYFDLEYETHRRRVRQASNRQSFKTLNPEFTEKSFVKSKSVDICNIDDIIDINIEATNIGNFVAKDVVIKDSLSTALEFIKDSLYVNGEQVDFNIFTTGVIIKNIEPNEKFIISYKARAIDIISAEKTSASLYYSYNNTKDIIKVNSNDLKNVIIGARLGNDSFDMYMNNYTSQIGDSITYMVLIENTGNVNCLNLNLVHPLNNALEFIDESLIIDGSILKDSNIFNGITIDKVEPNQIVNISYKLKVIDFPRPNPISNKLTLKYDFNIGRDIKTKTIYSKKQKLYVNNPIISVIDKNSTRSTKEINTFNKNCYINESTLFNIELQNKGNVGLEDISLRIKLPKDLEFDESSLIINNSPYTKALGNSISLPNLNISQKIYIEFSAKHFLLKEYDLGVDFIIDYTFRDLKTNCPFKKYYKFKEKISILNPDIKVSKVISDKFIENNKEFTENLSIKNTGNIKLYDVDLDLNESEFLSACSKIIFINGNYLDSDEPIKINEIDINETVNLAIRYKVDSLLKYESTIPASVATAKYKIASHSNFNIVKGTSNALKLEVRYFNLDIDAKCTSDIIMVDSINKFILNISNVGNTTVNNAKLKLNLPREASYLENTFSINGKNIFLKGVTSKIDIGELKVNESKIISFDFVVSSLPYQNQFEIDSNITCNYNFDENLITKEFSSNKLLLDIENVSIDVVKFVNPQVLQAEDIVEVQVIINNTSTTDIKNLFLKDNFNKSLVFLEGSVIIDGEIFENLTPVDGIELRDLGLGENILLTYQYKYIAAATSNKITYFSDVKYMYTLNDGSTHTVNTKTEPIYLECTLSTFKEFNMENEYHLEDFEPDIYEVLNTFTSANIENYYEINSIKNTALDNVASTGKKLVVKGIVIDRVEYLTESTGSSLYMLERVNPFTIFINLTTDYDFDEINLTAKCNNVFCKNLSCRDIFVSSLISIEGNL